jgi:uncharacterized protein
MTNAVSWFEIPALDFERAKKFYAELLQLEITVVPMPEGEYAVFPMDNEAPGASGAIMKMEGAVPSTDGPSIYFNGGEDLSVPLARVEPAGGKIIIPKTSIGENGFFAQFLDTEGNRLAFHSMK